VVGEEDSWPDAGAAQEFATATVPFQWSDVIALRANRPAISLVTSRDGAEVRDGGRDAGEIFTPYRE
jgi:hypothetical protein